MELYKHAQSSKRDSLFNSRQKRIDAKEAFTCLGKHVEEVNGVVMSVCIPAEGCGDTLNVEKYDEVCGVGAADRAINKARRKTLKQIKKLSKQSSGYCSEWRCDPCGCFLACIGAGVGAIVCGVASNVCCSFIDADIAIDGYNNFAGGSDDLSSKIKPDT
eukprot:jgi/Antlo1/1851/937